MAEYALAAIPIRAGRSLPPDEWREIRQRAIFEYCKWDVQCEDHSVLGTFPLIIEAGTARFLSEKAEALTREALSAEKEILNNPNLLGRLALPRGIRQIFERAETSNLFPRELRLMRFDFHFTTNGWRISEVNADVPGGFIEASGWNFLFADKWRGATAPPNTSDLYAHAIRDVAGQGALAALVHATAYSDDRQVMMHLAQQFAAHGIRACLCSPSHVHWHEGRAKLRASFASGNPDIIVRFFPAEWLPNLSREDAWRPYFQSNQTPLSNPGTAILLQTKRFPLVWDKLWAHLSTWRELLPETRDFSECGTLASDAWVLKPALGRVGEGVGIWGITPVRELKELIRQARRQPQHWIAQKRFEILPIVTEEGPQYPCIGVFTIGGNAAGFYGRTAASPIINRDARDVAVLISGEPSKREN